MPTPPNDLLRKSLYSVPTGALLLCYWPVIHDTVSAWATSRMYSYGFLIPPVGIYLVWRRREELRTTSVRPSYATGVAVLLGSIVALAVGQASGMATVQALSLIPGIAGVVLTLFGWRVFRKVALPIAYLLFMLPIWDIVTQPLHPPLQHLSANIAITILRVCGITVAQEGTTMVLPNMPLEVGPDCSGVNYLVAVVAVGIPATYIFLNGLLIRVFLVLLSVVIAALGNGVRIGLIGIFAYNDVGSAVHGPFHILQGVIISVLGFLVILVGITLLGSKQRKKAAPAVTGADAVSVEQELTTKKGGVVALILASAVLALGGGYVHFYKPAPVPLREALTSLPLDLGVWKGREGLPSQFTHRLSNADHELLRVYRTAEGAVAEVYIAYYGVQKEGKELVTRKTKRLHDNARMVTLPVETGDGVGVNKTISLLGRERELILFWYELGGETITDPYRAKWRTTWRALTSRRTEGAFVAVATTVTSVVDEATRLAELNALAETVFRFVKQLSIASSTENEPPVKRADEL